MTKLEIKLKLKSSCENFVVSKMETIQNTITSNKDALESESKSSAGDKHETGRAMLQLEMEKAGQQLSQVQQMKLLVEKINVSRLSDVAALGTVVETERNKYFIGISVGQESVNTLKYFIISPGSPIGRLILGKKSGDTFIFQGLEQKIISVY